MSASARVRSHDAADARGTVPVVGIADRPMFVGFAIAGAMPEEVLEASAVLVESMRRPGWHVMAECRRAENAHVDFYAPADKLGPALEVCSGCAARYGCREDALRRDDNFGCWGGTTPADRRRIRAERDAEGPDQSGPVRSVA